MNELTRTENSIRNTILGLVTQVLTVLISFVTRSFFIRYLSIEYLGVNGLFTSILTVLSLAELGFGSAMIYSMYAPLAKKDETKLRQLIKFYSKIYKIIGLAIGGIGLILIPFLGVLINDAPDVGNLTPIYLLFLLNSVVSYLFVYKKTVLQADQKQSVISQIHLYISIFKAGIMITILILTKNYLLYLVVQVTATLLENIWISRKVNKTYTFIKEKDNSSLDAKEKASIWDNVKALMIYKVGSTILDGTDNIIIAAFVGVVSVGYLSNYVLITGSLTMVLHQITHAITGSVGNFVTTENEEKQETLFHRLGFVYFVVYGFSFVALFMLLNPFITVWLGSDYTLPTLTVLVISLNWYIMGIMNPVWTFRATKGLFKHGKYRPAISAVINVVVSIALAFQFGLIGVLLGTTITRLSTNIWYDPYIVFKHGFNKKATRFYVKQVLYLLTLIVPIGLLTFAFGYLDTNIVSFIIKMILVTVVTLVVIIVFYRRTDEYKYFKQLLTRFAKGTLIE